MIRHSSQIKFTDFPMFYFYFWWCLLYFCSITVIGIQCRSNILRQLTHFIFEPNATQFREKGSKSGDCASKTDRNVFPNEAQTLKLQTIRRSNIPEQQQANTQREHSRLDVHISSNRKTGSFMHSYMLMISMACGLYNTLQQVRHSLLINCKGDVMQELNENN